MEEPELRRVTLMLKERPEDGWEDRLEWVKKNAPIGITLEFVVQDRSDRLDGQFFLDETARLAAEESELIDGGIDIDSIGLL